MGNMRDIRRSREQELAWIVQEYNLCSINNGTGEQNLTYLRKLEKEAMRLLFQLEGIENEYVESPEFLNVEE